MGEGELACFYEGPTGPITYAKFGIEDLLPGAAWVDGEPSFEVTPEQAEVSVGETVELSATIGGIEATDASKISWTFTADDAAGATLSAETGAQVTLTATAAGAGTVTARYEFGETALTSSIRIFISDDETVTVPDQYLDNPLTSTTSGGSNAYARADEAQLGEGVYVVYGVGNSRILYLANNGATTNHVTPASQSADELKEATGYDSSTQTWKLESVDGGYTLYNEAAQKYLTADNGSGGITAGATAAVLTVSYDAANDAAKISTVSGTETRYLARSGNAFTWTTTEADALQVRLYEKVTSYFVEPAGLEGLVADMSALTDETLTGWAEFKDARDAALKLVEDIEGAAYDTQADAETAQASAAEAAQSLYEAARDLHACSFGTDWKSDATSHWYECSICGNRKDEGVHAGGVATCSKKAVCTTCGNEYGELDDSTHVNTERRGVVAATETTEGYTGDLYCSDCGDLLEKGDVIPATGTGEKPDPEPEPGQGDEPGTGEQPGTGEEPGDEPGTGEQPGDDQQGGFQQPGATAKPGTGGTSKPSGDGLAQTGDPATMAAALATALTGAAAVAAATRARRMR